MVLKMQEILPGTKKMISQWWLSLLLFPSMPTSLFYQDGKPTAAGDLFVRNMSMRRVVGIVHQTL